MWILIFWDYKLNKIFFWYVVLVVVFYHNNRKEINLFCVCLIDCEKCLIGSRKACELIDMYFEVLFG